MSKLDLPDESKDTPLQSRLRTLWHDNFNEPEFIEEAEALLKVEVAKAKIEELKDQIKFGAFGKDGEKVVSVQRLQESIDLYELKQAGVESNE